MTDDKTSALTELGRAAEQWLAELAELHETIAELREEVAQLKAELAGIKAILAELSR